MRTAHDVQKTNTSRAAAEPRGNAGPGIVSIRDARGIRKSCTILPLFVSQLSLGARFRKKTPRALMPDVRKPLIVISTSTIKISRATFILLGLM
jgi:hypothetical protein